MVLDKPYKLFSNCLITKGDQNFSIVDTQREDVYILPNIYFDIVTNKEFNNISEVLSTNSDDITLILKDLFTYLDENELIYFSTEFDLFPELITDWDYPAKITNGIILFNYSLLNSYKNIVSDFNKFLCNYLEIWVLDIIEIKHLESLLNLFKDSTIFSIDLKLSKYEKSTSLLTNLITNYPRVNEIVVYNSVSENLELDRIKFIKGKLSAHQCGKINQAYFSPNIHTYFESIKHNSCLNRKISIDSEGNIKNCPSMAKSFGNIKDTTLAEAIEKPGFKKYWNINKDKIHVCKDCEFRYICTDCRAYVEDPEDILSKPLKCVYNPYTGEWSEWSTNPLKQKAIDFYGMRDIVEEMGSGDSELT